MRRVAFFAIVISTAAVVASIVTMPMLYSYVASFQSHLITETEFCKTRSRDMWSEMSILNKQNKQEHARGKRQYGPVVNAEPSCCSCQQGPTGPAGAPGDNGENGPDGHDGTDGEDGRDGTVLKSAIPVNFKIIVILI